MSRAELRNALAQAIVQASLLMIVMEMVQKSSRADGGDLIQPRKVSA